MSKILGAILAGLVVLNTGLPTLHLGETFGSAAALGVGVLIAGLSFYLRGPGTPPAE